MYSFVQVLPGFSRQRYWEVVAALGQEPFDGLLLHLAGPCEDGWRIIQVWRNADDYAQFSRGQLWGALAGTGALSGVSAPMFEMLEVAHLVTARTDELRQLE